MTGPRHNLLYSRFIYNTRLGSHHHWSKALLFLLCRHETLEPLLVVAEHTCAADALEDGALVEEALRFRTLPLGDAVVVRGVASAPAAVDEGDR